jgi:hypothetical protein
MFMNEISTVLFLLVSVVQKTNSVAFSELYRVIGTGRHILVPTFVKRGVSRG